MNTISLFDESVVSHDSTLHAGSRVQASIDGAMLASTLSDAELVEAIERLNAAYRGQGAALVSDARYDSEFIAELRARLPDHPFLQMPEPEEVVPGKRVKHGAGQEMLSTQKLRNDKEVEGWIKQIEAAAASLGIAVADVRIRVTPKLDGTAARRDGDQLVTRGKNGFGTDISHVLPLGVQVRDRRDGPGEIVIRQQFFDVQIAQVYGLEHPRNFCTGLIGAETLEDYHRDALSAGACHFVQYETLEGAEVGLVAFGAEWSQVMRDVQQNIPFLCDGAVAEVVGEPIRAVMGATSHHHRWQAALKENVESADTTIESIRLACGRTGRIVPVVSIAPVRLYGVTITNVTAHTAGHLERMGLGVGAKVRVTRSGGVIPLLQATLEPAPVNVDLSKCPSCGGPTEWEGTHLVCPSTTTCKSQSVRALQHFFATLGGVCNGFGPTVTEALVAAGHQTPLAVYALDASGFEQAEISGGVARNLVAELQRSKVEPIPDAIFLGAFGIRHLGRGDSRKLLAHVDIEALDTLTVEQLAGISGFGALTSGPIVESLRASWPLIRSMLDLGFNLERTPKHAAQASVASAISGMTVVFTGTMASGDRPAMEARARALGATVGSGVTGKTTLLICGANVGAAKTDKAAKLKVRVISEAEYLAMIAGPAA